MALMQVTRKYKVVSQVIIQTPSWVNRVPLDDGLLVNIDATCLSYSELSGIQKVSRRRAVRFEVIKLCHLVLAIPATWPASRHRQEPDWGAVTVIRTCDSVSGLRCILCISG